MKQIILVLSALVLLSACATSNDGALVITNVTVIDATGAPARPASTVVVRSGRIVSVGPASGTRVPRGARVVDGSGKFLIPGLFDMHTHLSFWGADALP